MYAKDQVSPVISNNTVTAKEETIPDRAQRVLARLGDVAARLSAVSAVLTGESLIEPDGNACKQTPSLENDLREANFALNTIEGRLGFIETRLAIK